MSKITLVMTMRIAYYVPYTLGRGELLFIIRGIFTVHSRTAAGWVGVVLNQLHCAFRTSSSSLLFQTIYILLQLQLQLSISSLRI